VNNLSGISITHQLLGMAYSLDKPGLALMQLQPPDWRLFSTGQCTCHICLLQLTSPRLIPWHC